MAPDYAMMVGLATIIGSWLALRQAAKDGAKVHLQARALVVAYLAALLGGYLFEWIRAIPTAIALRSLDPITFAGRAAYGGLIFGTIAPMLYLHRKKQTFLDFLDRATLGMGLVFACVRFGCFLEGCDYGRPTSFLLGVRFPAGSAAAEAHTMAGWVAAGAPSLPVHPTELYESAIGLLATAFALIPLRRGQRNGAAFGTWLVVYALGRFSIELLRGDVERGHYGALSTAQWVSIGILAIVLMTMMKRRAVTFATAAMAFILVPRSAAAQVPEPAPATTDSPVVIEQPPAPPPPTPPPPPAEPVRRVTARLGLASSLTIARPDVPSGWAMELDALYRLKLGSTSRLDIGLEGRRYENVEAVHWSLGVAAELVLVGGKHFELLFTFVPHHTWFVFKSDFFETTNAYGVRYGMGAQFPFGPVVFGLSPLDFTTTSSTTVGVITQWEPRFWGGFSF
jgi:prolipoprotein diacylglyceryltransferase